MYGKGSKYTTGKDSIYAPVNLTAPCIILFMWASPLRGGLGPGTLDICG